MGSSRNLFARKGDVESRKSGHKREYLNNSRADAELAQKIAKMHHTLMPTNFCPKQGLIAAFHAHQVKRRAGKTSYLKEILETGELSADFMYNLGNNEHVLTSCILEFIPHVNQSKSQSIEMKKLVEIETQYTTLVCVITLMTEVLQEAYSSCALQLKKMVADVQDTHEKLAKCQIEKQNVQRHIARLEQNNNSRDSISALQLMDNQAKRKLIEDNEALNERLIVEKRKYLVTISELRVKLQNKEKHSN